MVVSDFKPMGRAKRYIDILLLATSQEYSDVSGILGTLEDFVDHMQDHSSLWLSTLI